LLAVPKNLVYIFLVAICIAFAGMIYVANTETGVTGMFKYDREVVNVTHPFYWAMVDNIHLDEDKIPIRNYNHKTGGPGNYTNLK